MNAEGMPQLPAALTDESARAARLLRNAGSVLIITHIDADGITAGSIAVETVRRLKKEYRISFEKKITDSTVEMVNSSKEDVVWICDLGSAYMSMFTRQSVIVTDHHVPDPGWRRGQSLLDAYDGKYQLNPHLYGHNGSYEICGAGMTYLLSRAVDPENMDLAYLGVIGAVGDFQDQEGSLVSWNRIVLQDAIAAGDVSIDTGVRYFGRESRSVVQFLEYGDDPRIPGVTGDRKACSKFLADLGIPETADGENRMWIDLSAEEKEKVAGRIREIIPDGYGRLVGEVYTINRYAPKSGMHDVKEFSTVLNSCGRYDDAETGLRICLGDASALRDAERNRREHRRSISQALTYVRDNHLMRRRSTLQYFDAGDTIRETVVGVVAGMILGSEIAEPGLPIFAFVQADDGIKVSARAPRELSQAGLDLSALMHDAAEAVGGMGGGHSVAAGATIPEGKTEAFLDAAEGIIAAQLGKE